MPLRVRSHGSLLFGTSPPETLVRRALELGYRALALTDECSLAGSRWRPCSCTSATAFSSSPAAAVDSNSRSGARRKESAVDGPLAIQADESRDR